MTDETKLKEIVKKALIEVLDERRDMAIAHAGAAYPVSRRGKALVLWIAFVLAAILLFQIVQRAMHS